VNIRIESGKILFEGVEIGFKPGSSLWYLIQEFLGNLLRGNFYCLVDSLSIKVFSLFRLLCSWLLTLFFNWFFDWLLWVLWSRSLWHLKDL
jgi:hypothetical protein